MRSEKRSHSINSESNFDRKIVVDARKITAFGRPPRFFHEFTRSEHDKVVASCERKRQQSASDDLGGQQQAVREGDHPAV
jgi:hypothetical protein